MSMEDYSKALKMGKRDYQRHLSLGSYPYLQALDEITSHIDIVSEVRLGLVSVPAELIIGTKTIGRRTAFAPNFMPLLEPKSEFGSKWISLCDSHLEEGIHDPIVAYEFMNRFYVAEGNKRVSVLKYFDAATIPAIVTRMVPPRTDDKDNKIYYEYMDFYKLTAINYLWFSKEGSFMKLAKAVSQTEEPWDEDTRLDFSAAYTRFKNAFQARDGKRLPITAGDAALVYINIFGYDVFKDSSQDAFKENILKIWDEFLLIQADDTIELVMDPVEEQKKSLFSILLPQAPKKFKIGFIHTKNARISSWTYSHELGRKHLEQVYPGKVETLCIDNVTAGVNSDEAIRQAISQGCHIIFTTSPELIGASLKAAVEYPDVKILNCSLNMSHSYIRTYYGRMYEAKFLCGAIAGSMAEGSRIGYIADYPIYGMTASINAFALGAKMVNPRSEIHLKWSTVKGCRPVEEFRSQGISFISSQDMIVPEYASRQFGLYKLDAEPPVNLATPLWHWGKFYEKITESIISGSWKTEETLEINKALNYWWGMSSDVIDLIYSSSIPPYTRRLIELLKKSITSSALQPFSGILYSQDGVISDDENHVLTPEEIITMDWLADNIVGEIPDFDQLTDDAKPVVLLQGIKKPAL